MLAYGARMGFHTPTLGGFASKDVNERIYRELSEAGINRDFLNRALATPSDDMWFPSEQELKTSGFISEMVPNSSAERNS
jgi:hypothetical protein